MPEFTMAETDNALYRGTVEAMADEEIIKEYKELLEARRRGYDRQYNLQLCFDIIRVAAELRGLDIHKAIASEARRSRLCRRRLAMWR